MYLLLVIMVKKTPKPMVVTRLNFHRLIAWLGEPRWARVNISLGSERAGDILQPGSGQVAFLRGQGQTSLVPQGGVW